MSKVHTRKEKNLFKIVIELPIPEEDVKTLVRQLDQCKQLNLNNVFMLWHANGNHALELIFERPLPPAIPITPTVPAPVPAPPQPTPPPEVEAVQPEQEVKEERKTETITEKAEPTKEGTPLPTSPQPQRRKRSSKKKKSLQQNK